MFVPVNASPAKVKNIRSYGAEVRTHATDSGITEVFARRYAEENGLAYISPYNDPVIVAGQGTLGLELARGIDRIDALYVALGGGLISGLAVYLKAIGRRVEVVACSPENSAVMHHSVAADGHPPGAPRSNPSSLQVLRQRLPLATRGKCGRRLAAIIGTGSPQEA